MMNELIDKVADIIDVKVIKDLAKDIKKKHYSVKSAKVVSSIAYLAHWLYLINESNLALEVCSIINGIKFENDYLIWEHVRSVLILESIIYQEQEKEEEAKQSLIPVKEVEFAGDESTKERKQRILKRVLDGSLLYDKFIQEDQANNDIRTEILHRFLQFKTLHYMRVMGGSEIYPIENLNEEIMKEKLFLFENINKARMI